MSSSVPNDVRTKVAVYTEQLVITDKSWARRESEAVTDAEKQAVAISKALYFANRNMAFRGFSAAAKSVHEPVSIEVRKIIEDAIERQMPQLAPTMA